MILHDAVRGGYPSVLIGLRVHASHNRDGYKRTDWQRHVTRSRNAADEILLDAGRLAGVIDAAQVGQRIHAVGVVFAAGVQGHGSDPHRFVDVTERPGALEFGPQYKSEVGQPACAAPAVPTRPHSRPGG